MKRDDTTPDDTLTAYLDGRDGLSALYARSASEESPAALDAVILRVAREETGVAARPETKARQGKWALAASLLLGVGLSSLYYENRALDAQSSLLKQSTPLVLEGDMAVRALRTEPGSSDDAARAVTEAGIADAAPEPAMSEEIVVTGSRIRADIAPPEPVAAAVSLPAWRNTQADWLEHLAGQRRALRGISAQQTALQQELDAELEAFRASYPGIDLDAALDALEQE